MKKKIALILSIVLLVTVGVVALVSCAPPAVSDNTDTSPIEVDMNYNYYLGLKNVGGGTGSVKVIDTLSQFGYDKFTVDDPSAGIEIVGDELKAKAVGEFELTCREKSGAPAYDEDGQPVILTIHVVDGINISTEQELRDNKNDVTLVVHGDIVAQGMQEDGGKKDVYDTFDISDTVIYGNGYEIVLERIISSAFDDKESHTGISASGACEIYDWHVIGAKREEAVSLSEFENFDPLIACTAWDPESKKRSLKLHHSILENGAQLLYVRASDTEVEGTIFRNGGDALIAAETCDLVGYNLTVKDSIMSNSVVAGVNLFGSSWGGTKSKSTFTIEGFLDIYMWKDMSKAHLVPSREPMSQQANDAIAKEFVNNKEAYSDIILSYNNLDYVHIGVMSLTTGGLNPENNANINGIEKLGYEGRKYPRKGLASMIMKDCKVYGFGKNGDKRITPDTKMAENIDYSKLWGDRLAD